MTDDIHHIPIWSDIALMVSIAGAYLILGIYIGCMR